MKAAFCGLSLMGACGAYMLAGSAGPDFDRVVGREPMAVYAAFSALGPEGTISLGPSADSKHRVTQRIEKTLGEEIHYEILVDDRPVIDTRLHFEPGPQNKGTRLTAEFDLDAYALGSAYETEAGVALSMVPDGYIDQQFASFMNHRVADIEAGRPLPPLDLDSSGMHQARQSGSSLAARRSIAEEERRAAAAPMVRARPMIDPDRAARDHIEGR
ncbi:MAG: hypothetical protein E6G92_10270 [Alphaproteobacteria bacterium]|nr:MAG: hypothetical protein E6G92_10270 [Alphaproteobacteria bacterium]